MKPYYFVSSCKWKKGKVNNAAKWRRKKCAGEEWQTRLVNEKEDGKFSALCPIRRAGNWWNSKK
jgi:hypothetical protein